MLKRPSTFFGVPFGAKRPVHVEKVNPGSADSEIVGLRVGIKNGGCAGQSYTVEYAHEIRPTDEVVEDRGVKIMVDPKAVLFLLGTEMDYKADKMQAQFIFNNPNQVSACGCGESVQLTAAKV